MIPAAAVLHHLGDLHPFETVLVMLLAFGPFVVIVLLVVRDHQHKGSVHDDTPTQDVSGPSG